MAHISPETRISFYMKWIGIRIGLCLNIIILALSNSEGSDNISPILSGGPKPSSTGQSVVASSRLTDQKLVNLEPNSAIANDEERQKPTRHRAVYLYAERNHTGEQIKKLMSGYRLDCRLIDVKDLNAEVLQDAELIIVDAGTVNSWEIEAAVAIVKKSKLPVLAMGEGGAQLFGKLDLRIGAPNGKLRKGTPLKPDSEAIFWDGFRPELIDGSYNCSSEGQQVSIELKDSFDSVIVLAAENENEKYSPLIVQKPHYLLWGFNGTHDEMTRTGHQLFAWACYYSMAMKENPDRAFMSKSEVERIREKQK